MTITEKVSYIKGLADGLELDENNKQDKLLKAIIDVLEDMATSVADLEDGYDELCEQVDAVDEDLSDLEEDYYGEDECDCCDHEDDDEDGEFYEVECPACHDVIYLDEDMISEGGIACPNCGTELEFDFESDGEDTAAKDQAAEEDKE